MAVSGEKPSHHLKIHDQCDGDHYMTSFWIEPATCYGVIVLIIDLGSWVYCQQLVPNLNPESSAGLWVTIQRFNWSDLDCSMICGIVPPFRSRETRNPRRRFKARKATKIVFDCAIDNFCLAITLWMVWWAATKGCLLGFKECRSEVWNKDGLTITHYGPWHSM